jgi:hypothetical protein
VVVGRRLARTFDATIVTLMVILVATYVALVCLVLPVLPPLPPAVVPLAIVPTFALVTACWTVSRRFANHDDPGPSVLAGRSRLLYWIVAALFVAYVILAIIAGVLQPDQDWSAGQPEIIGGHHYLNVHGDPVPVTKAEYQHGLRVQHGRDEKECDAGEAADATPVGRSRKDELVCGSADGNASFSTVTLLAEPAKLHRSNCQVAAVAV